MAASSSDVERTVDTYRKIDALQRGKSKDEKQAFRTTVMARLQELPSAPRGRGMERTFRGREANMISYRIAASYKNMISAHRAAFDEITPVLCPNDVLPLSKRAVVSFLILNALATSGRNNKVEQLDFIFKVTLHCTPNDTPLIKGDDFRDMIGDALKSQKEDLLNEATDTSQTTKRMIGMKPTKPEQVRTSFRKTIKDGRSVHTFFNAHIPCLSKWVPKGKQMDVTLQSLERIDRDESAFDIELTARAALTARPGR